MMSESKNSPTRNVTSGSPTFQLAAIGKSLRSSPMRLCGWTGVTEALPLPDPRMLGMGMLEAVYQRR
jgi:hypothetical protein